MSTNLSKIKREKMLETISKIKEKVDDDEIIKNLSLIEYEITKKKYGLVWEEHEERVDKQLETQIPTFEEIKNKEIFLRENEKFNFLLEGDNLHSLYLLEKTHKGKIDLIYIDPPYNTKNKDFVYNDKLIGEDDSYRHSKWLSFMGERLEIARKLLTEEGAIFIQIDDNEVAQLKLLCDEIFGEENFLNIISVNMKNIAGASGGGEDKRFKKNCEYIVIYAKNYDLLPTFNGAYDYEEISQLVERYKQENISWKYTSVFLDEGKKEYLDSTVDGDGNEIKIFKHTNYILKSISSVAKDNNITEKDVYYKYANRIIRTTMPQSSIRPRVMKKLNEKGYKNDLISIEYVPKTGKNKGCIYTQYYKGDKYNLFAWLSDVLEEKDGEYFKKNLQGTYWDFTAGTKNLTKEGNVVFPNGKKPIDLLKRIINLYPKNDITVLDYFAGSGTTGHAVISQNAEDEGKRNFILCTNNENNICEEITYKRLCNVIKGYVNDNGKEYLSNPANLKYYKTSFVPKINNDEENIQENLLVNIKNLIQLENGISVDDKRIRVILSEEEIDKFSENIEQIKECEKLYISSDILLTANQVKIFKDNNIEVFIIPEYYFDEEIKEVQ